MNWRERHSSLLFEKFDCRSNGTVEYIDGLSKPMLYCVFIIISNIVSVYVYMPYIYIVYEESVSSMTSLNPCMFHYFLWEYRV
jgi:hypothetical protein